ncbi:MAG: Ig-like domain-containing protein, partial [Clostridiales bacterium]|nr:Ig-like domain-containing protein [Clostridiales bacterium]
MKRKFLSILLTLAMVLTLLPTAAMAEGETVTLQSQIPTSGTVTLDKDYTEDITIPSGTDVTLDLGGKTLSNTNNSKATLSIEGTAVVKNGTISGGTGYYNIEVKAGGSLTLEDVTATAGNTGSSMIDNWGTLTITSGIYTGGLNVLKNEATGTVVIRDGTFELSYSSPNGFNGVVFNYGALEITGGTFIQSVKSSKYGQAQVIHTDVDKTATNPNNIMPKTEIEDGTFTNMDTRRTAWTIRASNAATPYTKVAGGNFNKSVFSSYLKDGFVCKKNTTTGMYEITTGATGVILSESKKTIKVGESFKLEATLTPEAAELKSVEWESSNEEIATVNENNGIVKGIAIGDVTITATPNAAGATPATCTVHVYDEVAQIGKTKYPTIEAALAEAQENDTITLLKNVSPKTTVEISKSVTLDLGGFTVTGPKVEVKSGQSKWHEYIALKVTDGTVTIKNGTVSGRVNVYDAANVTIEKDVTIKNRCYKSSSGYGIVVWGDGTYGQEGCKTPILNIYGKVNVTG